MADATPLYGTLGDAPLLPLLKVLILKNYEAQQFGWNKRGAGGTYALQTNYVAYDAHRADASGLQVFPFDAQITYNNDVPAWCAIEQVTQFAHSNVFCPFWFFDWCKQYLATLRAYQPAFDAPVEAKLVWVTQVAWVINAALGATNLHGSILPSAIFEHVTGQAFDQWAGDGSYMYTAQHAAALPDYWKTAWTQAANAVVARTSGPVLLDSGYKVFDRRFNVQWESAWRGGIFPVPLEASRYRFDPPISVREFKNFKADKWVMKGLAGPLYNNDIPNDPYIIRGSNGIFANDGGSALARYAAWSQFTPWLLLQPFGKYSSEYVGALDPSGRSMLSLALMMSTLFAAGTPYTSETVFWKQLDLWKTPAHQKPELVQTSARADLHASLTNSGVSIVPVYGPNYELSFRYFYPAMIDLLLKCDYYGLIKTGINTWWKYNINSGAGVGTFCATEKTQAIDPTTGQPLRDKNGIPYGAPIVPPGTVQEQYSIYQDEQERQKSIKIAINLAQSFIAIIQAVYGGNYGALVTAGKSWYDSFSQKFPAPEDSWRGVVPPTPLVQRRIPTYGFVGGRDNPQPVIPDVTGWASNTPVVPPLGGGVSVVPMMASVRNYIGVLGRYGAPFVLTPEDRIDLEGIRNPVFTLKPDAPRSTAYPDFPVPGFQPGSDSALDALNTPVVPAKRSKAGLLILGCGLLAGAAGVLVTKGISWRKHG